MTPLSDIQKQLRELSNPEKAAFFPRFFKSGPGQYGEGDRFLGVTVPDIRSVAKANFTTISTEDLKTLHKSVWHEDRLLALLLLVQKYERDAKTLKERQSIVNHYLANTCSINNWDLVDLSAHKILGAHVLEIDNSSILYQLAKSKNMWERRIAIVATWTLIREHKLDDTFALAEQYLPETHDLMHKATGWMLREAGKRDQKRLEKFLNQHIRQISRTTLRYAIEKFDEPLRQKYLKL